MKQNTSTRFLLSLCLWSVSACQRCATNLIQSPQAFFFSFLRERVPFLLQMCLNAAAARIYFISAEWVTPARRPSAQHSQIAVSQAYLWHDLWVGVTPDSQKDRHCPATALNSCRIGALSALRQTRPPPLKRIKLFHHVGNEKAVITPNQTLTFFSFFSIPPLFPHFRVLEVGFFFFPGGWRLL